MKNIHLLPTDKPSRLIIYSTLLNEFRLLDKPIEDWKHKKHIYITNDEEIKELTNDWFIETDTNEIYKSDWIKFRFNNGKKIILTTDQDLIKDGVQAIDDKFLEWFVKNPSCEEVEVKKGFADGTDYGYNFLDYKIIIPKEEPKQETLEEATILAWDLYEHTEGHLYSTTFKNAFKLGANWKAERMYSEEEVLDILFTMSVDNPNDITKWFEQFKNKQTKL